MTDEDLFPIEPNAIWLAVFVTEFILIFMVNAFTIIAFARKQHLRVYIYHWRWNLVKLSFGNIS